MESLATQTLVVFVIRTAGKPFRSRPRKAMLISVVTIALIAIYWPYSPLGPLHVTPLPAPLLATMMGLTVTYLMVVQWAKGLVLSATWHGLARPPARYPLGPGRARDRATTVPGWLSSAAALAASWGTKDADTDLPPENLFMDHGDPMPALRSWVHFLPVWTSISATVTKRKPLRFRCSTICGSTSTVCWTPSWIRMIPPLPI